MQWVATGVGERGPCVENPFQPAATPWLRRFSPCRRRRGRLDRHSYPGYAKSTFREATPGGRPRHSIILVHTLHRRKGQLLVYQRAVHRRVGATRPRLRSQLPEILSPVVHFPGPFPSLKPRSSRSLPDKRLRLPHSSLMPALAPHEERKNAAILANRRVFFVAGAGFEPTTFGL